MSDPDFLLLGDALWLDFVNTAATAPGLSEALPDPGAWLRWTKAVRVESPASAQAYDDALRFRSGEAVLGLYLERLVKRIFKMPSVHRLQPPPQPRQQDWPARSPAA